MVISPKMKLITLSLLIIIVLSIAFVVVGVVSVWDESQENHRRGGKNKFDNKMMSSQLQQFTASNQVAAPTLSPLR